MTFNFKSTDTEKHSAAHILAAAVQRVFPKAKIGIGPVNRDGFFYDFDIDRKLTSTDIEAIEKQIQNIIKEKLPFTQVTFSKAEAENLLSQTGQIYKAEIVKALPDEQVSFYKLGEEFIDLCRGPHVRQSSDLRLIKINKIEKVHWKNDETKPLLTRIHGHVFADMNEYETFKMAEERSTANDFITVATELGYITKGTDNSMIHTRSGSSMFVSISEFINEELSFLSPREILSRSHLSKLDLDNIFDSAFRSKNRSYRNLPITLYTPVDYQDERKGLLMHGEMLAYKFYFNKVKHLANIGSIVDSITRICNIFCKNNLKVDLRSESLDNPYQTTVSSILEKLIVTHNKVLISDITEDLHIRFISTDTVNRDHILAEMKIVDKSNNFFINSDNAFTHSSEITITFDIPKIMTFMVEEYRYDIPNRFKPTQVVFIPISNKLSTQLEDMVKDTRLMNTRHFIDKRSESLNRKIRDAEKKLIPLICMVGQKELNNNAVSLRRNGQPVGLISIEDLTRLHGEVNQVETVN